MTDKMTENMSRPVKRVPCEVYSRIVGYLRPLQAWNKGKQQEFAERRMYAVQESVPGSLDLTASTSPSDDPENGAGQRVEQERPCSVES